MSKRNGKSFNLYFTDEQRAELDRLSAEHGVCCADVLRAALEHLGGMPSDRVSAVIYGGRQ